MGYIGSDPVRNDSVSTAQLVDDAVTGPLLPILGPGQIGRSQTGPVDRRGRGINCRVPGDCFPLFRFEIGANIRRFDDRFLPDPGGRYLAGFPLPRRTP